MTDKPSIFKPEVHIGDSENLDAFGRLRVSNPFNTFDIQHQYNKQPLFWEESTVTGGSSAHDPNRSSVKLTVDGTNNAEVVRQTKQYFRYQPGKSQYIAMTGNIGVKKTGVRQRWGYFDDDNGIFFEQDATNLKVVRRTKTTGSVVDDAVNQDDWNIDKLDGNGLSEITLDTSKSNIYVIDLQWLGTGRVRLGVDMGGIILYCHEFINANDLTVPYMTTANLPIRYTIKNISAIGTSTDLLITCLAVTSEGGFNPLGVPGAADNGVTKRAVSGELPLISIRPALTFNSITNRGTTLPKAFSLLSEDDIVFYKIVLNGSLTNASFSDVDATNSIVQKDVAATAISGGLVVDSGYLTGAKDKKEAGTVNQPLMSKLVLTVSKDASTSDILSLVVNKVNNNSDCLGGFSWIELY